MSKRQSINPIGLSMMDVVSNALGAVIILFFILSSVRDPAIPIERACGTAIIEMVTSRGDSSSSIPWIKMPDLRGHNMDSDYRPRFGDDILALSDTILKIPGGAQSCDSILIKSPAIIPAIRVYSIDEEFFTRHVIVLHNPVIANHQFGILYSDNKEIENDTVPEIIHCNITYWGNDMPVLTLDSVTTLLSSTRYCSFSFDPQQTEKWKNK